MLASLRSSTLLGIDATPVDVEVDVVGGLPGYNVVGLAAQSVREGAVRIRAALEAVGQQLPPKKITVNLAPADLPKPGTGFDLPIAVGVLLAETRLSPRAIDGLLLIGELGLDGTLRAVRGALAAATLARAMGLRGILLPAASAREAAVVDGLEVYGARHLQDIVATLTTGVPLHRVHPVPSSPRPAPGFDLSEVRGQEEARIALEIGVAGGHNLLLVGPPGIGKSMLARRIPTILPPMTHAEQIEVTKIYSAVGTELDGLLEARPFRSPHQSISSAALLGGGSVPRPGEITLAHHGALFLDELAEYHRCSLEALRQPLEDREVVIARAHSVIRFPASFSLIAAVNPCPCGWAGTDQRECTCTPSMIDRYRGRLSGPLLDRIDLQVKVTPVPLYHLRTGPPGECSAAVRERVVLARQRQLHRLAPFGHRTNAEMGPTATRATCTLTASAESYLSDLVAARRSLTARGIDRLIKVGRTIADLAATDLIDRHHLRLAASFRAFDHTAPAVRFAIPSPPTPSPGPD